MKAILPTKKFSPQNAWDAVEKEFEESVIKYANKEFSNTHEGWSADSFPDEIYEKNKSDKSTIWYVGRDGLIYFFVSVGTGPRWLESETPMFFLENYSASTSPGSTRSTGHSQSGAQVGPTWGVWHSTEPREFNVTVLALVEKYIPSRAKALSNAVVNNIWK
jgi:hypothetical protein